MDTSKLAELSDDELAQRYWTANADDVDSGAFAAIENEIRSRGAGIVPWVS